MKLNFWNVWSGILEQLHQSDFFDCSRPTVAKFDLIYCSLKLKTPKFLHFWGFSTFRREIVLLFLPYQISNTNNKNTLNCTNKQKRLVLYEFRENSHKKAYHQYISCHPLCTDKFCSTSFWRRPDSAGNSMFWGPISFKNYWLDVFVSRENVSENWTFQILDYRSPGNCSGWVLEIRANC